MKRTRRSDLVCWGRFDETRDLDFDGYAWLPPGGAILFDPVELSDHDRAQLAGGVAWIAITKSDRVRTSVELADAFGPSLAGSAAEREALGVECQRWLGGGDELAPGPSLSIGVPAGAERPKTVRSRSTWWRRCELGPDRGS